MNHKILTNQIMLSPTEGYLSTCPSCFSLLALSALSLSHLAIKNLLARSLVYTWSFWGPHFLTEEGPAASGLLLTDLNQPSTLLVILVPPFSFARIWSQKLRSRKV
jgi:hypothetical protein